MNNDILIAYYSWSGNTRKIAEQIQKLTGGGLFEIKPVQPYADNYSEVVRQAKNEIRSGFLPELTSFPENNSYKTLFIGSPNWWNTMAPPAASFLSGSDLDGKTVIPFITHGGGGAGTFERDVANLCPGSEITKGYSLYNDGGISAAKELDLWLTKIGMKR